MHSHKTILTILFSVFFLAAYAQGESATIKITDVNGVSTVVKGASSSSSSSCNSPDFPALKGGSRKDINFNELKYISILPTSPSGNEIYTGVELEYKDGKTETLEIIKNIRFSGRSDAGDFSIPVKDISMVEVL